VNEYLSALLAYIDKPWKVLAVVVLVLVGGAGWIVYEKRDAIIESWLTPSEPELKTALIPDALEKLTIETTADLVQIWSIDLPTNVQQFYAARRHDGERPVIPTPRRLPVITTASSAKALVDILNGHPVCVELNEMGTPLAERLAQRGMRRGCAIPIPPSADSFVGIIYLAWLVPPDERSENIAIGAARDIARTLVAQ
jgi:hypothetical protein